VVVQRLRATFDLVNLEKYEKRVVVAHDWGCYYFYLFDKVFTLRFRLSQESFRTSSHSTSQPIRNPKAFLLTFTW
jgi:hypothetical protein